MNEQMKKLEYIEKILRNSNNSGIIVIKKSLNERPGSLAKRIEDYVKEEGYNTARFDKGEFCFIEILNPLDKNA